MLSRIRKSKRATSSCVALGNTACWPSWRQLGWGASDLLMEAVLVVDEGRLSRDRPQKNIRTTSPWQQLFVQI
jgi:hypothetical protein